LEELLTDFQYQRFQPDAMFTLGKPLDCLMYNLTQNLFY